ncbi:MAG: hypothetical protein Q4F70_02580 [Clostridia bacterium]|nr:hypothetical protein [Clostridia bacterium]
MSREIGSEFWDAPTKEVDTDLFPHNIEWFLSGRVALKSIIHEIKRMAHSVAMPSWCCESMVEPFLSSGIDVEFYPVYLGEYGILQEICLECDALFVMDYFGYSTALPDLSNYKGIVIRDVTHSFFSANYQDADYYFGSLRKWCGVWTGGYAWPQDGHKLQIEEYVDLNYISLREKAMQLKCHYVEGAQKNGYDCTNDKEYLKVFEKAEAILESGYTVSGAAKRDVEIAKKLDIDLIKKRRISNAKVLMDELTEYLIFPKLKQTDCPMFVPIVVPEGKRNRLRQYLIWENIYCPIHWPLNKNYCLDGRARFLYDNELSLVCDQRYSEDDMRKVVAAIKLFLVRD